MKRMYILVLDDLPVGMAINTACHAAVVCALQYQDHEDTKEWLQTHYRKVTCKVSREEFDRAIAAESDHIVMTEINLDNRETAVAFRPRDEYHKMFKFLTLYK